MRQQHQFKWAGALVAVVIAMGMLSKAESEEENEWLANYCKDAAIWAAEEARGVPLNQRTGQPDYRGIAEESCPGMRPAVPSLDNHYRSPAQLAMPDTVPLQQLVQF